MFNYYIMNSKIYDDNYRRKFLDTASIIELNKYIKNIEALAKKKGGIYLEMYNKDMEYLTNFDDDISTPNIQSNCLGLFMKCDESENNNLLTEVCNTEAYVNNIEDICEAKFTELENLGNIILKPQKIKDKKLLTNSIQQYIDIVCTCDSFEQKDRPKLCRIFRKIGNGIIQERELTILSYKYFGELLKANKCHVSEEFIKEYSDTRSKNNITKVDKDNIVQEYIKTKGFQVICTSRLIESVINKCNILVGKK